MFYKGKRGYVKVDPYRMTLKFSKNTNLQILATLKELFGQFFRKFIQNNVGEGSNNAIISLLKLCESKTELSIENRICPVVIVRNHPKLLNEIQIERNISGDFITNNLISTELAHLMSQGRNLAKI